MGRRRVSLRIFPEALAVEIEGEGEDWRELPSVPLVPLDSEEQEPRSLRRAADQSRRYSTPP